MKPVRILIIDDHGVVREGLRLVVSRQANWEICGMASSGLDGIHQAVELQPHVILLDLNLPDLSGLEVVREMRRRVPTAELVIFSSERSEELIQQLFEAGAKSFVRKADGADSIVAAIKAAAQHRPYFTFETSQILFAKYLGKDSTNGNGEKLTDRERQVIRHVAEGRSNKQTASLIGVSTRTVEAHRAAIMRKVGASGTAEIVRYAIRNRMIEA